MRYIFIIGGVVSSIGKGITLASLGYLLKARKLNISIQKLDPYINLNPGNMNPFQHGEIFVTDDGLETDLDLGHYERFLNINLNKYSNVTAGRVYKSVLEEEQAGVYGGNTVQVIPHITNKIKAYIFKSAQLNRGCDISLHEIGGTVGDIESLPFFEALRQLIYKLKNQIYVVLISYIPEVGPNREIKTKPTQHSIATLRSIGIQINALVCRSRLPIPLHIKDKISSLTGLENIYNIHDIDSIYKVPRHMHDEGIDTDILRYFNYNIDVGVIATDPLQLKEHSNNRSVRIGIVGKYTEGADAYLSIIEALNISAAKNSYKLKISWLSTSVTKNKSVAELLNYDGIVIPGGFGIRGMDEKIRLIQLYRENNLPVLGICLGMQCMLIEYAINVLKIKDANTEEVQKNGISNIICANKNKKMTLGGRDIFLKSGSVVSRLYKKDQIRERHRHRYKFNNQYLAALDGGQLRVSGTSIEEIDGDDVVEFVELPENSNNFYVGIQAHPEFTSRPDSSHPLFDGFLKAAVKFNVKKDK